MTGKGGARPDPTAGLPLATGCSQMICSCWMQAENQPGICFTPPCPRSPSQRSRAVTGAEQGASSRPPGAGSNVGGGRGSSPKIPLHLPHGAPHELLAAPRPLQGTASAQGSEEGGKERESISGCPAPIHISLSWQLPWKRRGLACHPGAVLPEDAPGRIPRPGCKLDTDKMLRKGELRARHR